MIRSAELPGLDIPEVFRSAEPLGLDIPEVFCSEEFPGLHILDDVSAQPVSPKKS